MTMESIAVEPTLLAQPSAFVAERLLRRLPELRDYARMTPAPRSDEFDLLVEIPSPTGDPNRQVVVWMENGLEPSIEFGEWHTHAS